MVDRLSDWWSAYGSEESRGQDTHAVLLLLDLQLCAIFKTPLDDVRLLAGTFDIFRLADARVEVREVLKLDEMPDVREWGFDNRGLHDGSACWNGLRHLGPFEPVLETD